MEVRIFLTSIILCLTIYKNANAQKACSYTTTRNPTTSGSFLENFSTSKCLRVDALGLIPNSKVVLADCSYSKTPSADMKFSLVSSPLGKTLLKTIGSNGDSLCLTMRNGVLHNSVCQSSNFDHNWTLKKTRDNGNQFLIEQYSSKKCLVPKSRDRGSVIKLLPCNSLQTEQLWQICSK